MTVAVVTPWLDHLELAPEYFRALELGPRPDEVLVVDNGSDPALDFAVIRNDTNAGFSRASNQGLYAATSDIVVFLNNDVEPTEHGWLDSLVGETEPGVLAGAKLRRDAHGAVDGQPLPYLDGWCLAGTREDLLALGGFDEGYAEPSYYGDNDLSLRARAAGMTLREVHVGLIHKGNATSGGAANPAVRGATITNYQRFAGRARELMTVST